MKVDPSTISDPVLRDALQAREGIRDWITEAKERAAKWDLRPVAADFV